MYFGPRLPLTAPQYRADMTPAGLLVVAAMKLGTMPGSSKPPKDVHDRRRHRRRDTQHCWNRRC